VTVFEAVEGELAGVQVAPGLQAAALKLAERLDDPRTSATAASNCAWRLGELMKEIRALAPPEKKADVVDEIKERRARRRKTA